MAFSKYGLAVYGLNVYGGIPTIEFDYMKPGKRVLFVKKKDTEFNGSHDTCNQRDNWRKS